jgi:hypothetical protein
LTLLLGLAIAVHGFTSDPFNIPFQYYEQLPKDLQLLYKNESKNSKKIQCFALGMFFTALGSVVFLRLTKKR